jgi:predicted XRE-type DNA-binding protein
MTREVRVNIVSSLRDLRRTAGKRQKAIATALHIKQPSVSKLERQADMHISTLRSYIEAIGGELDLLVRFPARCAVKLDCLGLPGTHGEHGPVESPAAVAPATAAIMRAPNDGSNS